MGASRARPRGRPADRGDASRPARGGRARAASARTSTTDCAGSSSTVPAAPRAARRPAAARRARPPPGDRAPRASRSTASTDGALERLAGYPWPGNVRELEAVLEEAMLLRGRGALRAEDLALPESATGAPRLASPATSLPRAPPRRAGGSRSRWRRRTPGCRPSELARAAGVGLALARRELGALVAAGALRRTGAGRAVRYVR